MSISEKSAFSNITHHSTNVSWFLQASGNTPQFYELYYSTNPAKPVSATLPTVDSITTTQLSLTSLSFNTVYFVWLRSRCSQTDASVWTFVDSFRTLCTPVIPPTSAEPFDVFLPSCWVRDIGPLTNSTQFSGFDVYRDYQYWRKAPYINQSGSTNYAAKAIIDSDTIHHWLITPTYDLGAAGNNFSLEFDMALTKNSISTQGSLSADDKFTVVISTDEGSTFGSANILRNWTYPEFIPVTGQHVIIPLSAYSGVVRIGFYVESTVTSPSNTAPNLFIDNVKISTIMPVTLTDFTGKQQATANLLQWRTATEQNNKGFELQRAAPSGSPGGGEMGEFGTIGFVATKARDGNSTDILSYSYTDAKPFAGDNYYRLKQIDKDGKTTLSNVVLIKGGESEQLVLSALYPNPVRQTLNMVLNAPAAQRVQLVVTDMAGKVVQQQALQLVKGDNNNTVNVAGLQKGNYILKVMGGNGCEVVGKFLKE